MDQQSTLLEVFEAELAKDPSVVNNVLDSTRFPDPEISAIPSFAARSIPSANSLSKNVAAGQNAQAPQQVNPRLGGFKMISDYLHGFTAGDVEAAQELSQVIDHGVRTAAGGFDALLRRLTGSLEEASGRSQQAADRTREVDTQGIDDTIKGLRDFVACLTAGLKIPENDGKKDLKKESTKMDSAVIPARSMDNVTAGSSSDRVSAPPDGMSTGPTSCLQHETMDIDTNAKVKRPNSCDPLLSNPQARPDTVSLLYTLPQQYSSTSYEDTTSGPRYHKPGPIHLPHHTTMSSSASDNTDCVPLAGPRNRESERGFFSSTAYVDHFPGSRATSPPPAASRFPTLAQFEEGQNFAGAPSFPALPSMEPLVPRRVDGQSAGTVDDEPSNPVFDVTGSSQKSLEHNKLDPAVLAKDLLISNGIDPANLVPQFTSFMEQNPAVQQKSIQVYADNRAQRCPEPPKVVQPFMAKQEGPHVRTSDLVNQACDTKREFEEGHGKKSLLLGRQEAGLRYQNHRKNSEQPIDYSLQLKLLEQQNKKRLLLARQETESAYRPNEEKSEAEKDYEMQLTLLEQQKKKHQIMARNEAELRHQADQKESDQKQDYQMQLMLLEQQNKKRLLMARQEAEPVKSLDHESDAALLDRQLKSRLEQQSKKRIQMARPEQDTVSDGPKLPLVFSLETRPNNQTNEARLSNPFNAADDGIEQDSEQDTRPNSAARLVEPFDPLDVEPSARLHLTEGVRRNATVAGTSSRHNAPRRRPYSEAYDGFGRLGWESFLGGSHDEDHDSLRHPGTNLSRRQEHARKMRGSRGSGRYQRKQDQLRRSTTLHDTMPMSTPSFRRYDDEHQDDTTVAAINGCVNQLKDLGFGSDDDASGSRLLVYAQAAGGDLVEAIDMIDEEQRAYKERF